MRKLIDIHIPESILSENDEKIERLAKTALFVQTDRIPVVIEKNTELGLRGREKCYEDFYRSPEDNFREQILGLKWHFENIRDDSPIPTKSLTISPDLGALRGPEFLVNELISWPKDQQPVCRHPLIDERQIDALRIPSPSEGVNRMIVEWYQSMEDIKNRYDVRLNGNHLEIVVTIAQAGGPIPSAFALAGENLLLWTLTEPSRVHKLMRIVTESFINCVRYFDQCAGRNRNAGIGLGADIAEMFSPEQFQEFVVPYYKMVYEAFPGKRAFHMCGKIDHLLEIIRDELKIDNLHNFGYCTNVDLMAEKLAGKILLSGGPHPSTIQSGTREDIVNACERYIKALGTKGGFILGIGGGAAALTPPEHISYMIECSKLLAMRM